MMDATKIVGMRLMVHNEATTEILGNSPFKLIQTEVRSHKNSYVDFDEITDSHYNEDAWKNYDSATQEGFFNEDGQLIMYFPGDMTCKDAEERLLFLYENNIISHDLLSMKLQLMVYSNDSRQANLINWKTHQTNQAILRTQLSVQTFKPLNNGISTSDTWLRVSL